jgi:hypothetical protein
MDKVTFEFIKKHEHEEVGQLALQTTRFKEVDMTLALRQIVGKQKIKSKVPVFYATEELLYPQHLSLEQSSSESTAKYKSTLCEGNILVDLTGGFGIDCFFMSANFVKTFYVERDDALCTIARHNFNLFPDKDIVVCNSDGVEYLNNITYKASCIFIDPARRNEYGGKVFHISDCEPDVEKLHDTLCEKSNKVIIKLSPMLDMNAALKSLPATKEIYVVSVENECKELLFVLDKRHTGEIVIVSVNINKDESVQSFRFRQSEEHNSASVYSSPLQYLYEPNASLLKGGAFKLTGSRYGLFKLHKNTHLYTSDQAIQDFQGRIFKVHTISGISRKEMKLLQTAYPKANIACRNFPLTVNEIRKKTGITEGGDIYMFACKNFQDENIIIICTKYIEK